MAVTARLLRHSDGEWVHMDCRTELADDGIGLTHGTLSDPDGRVGVVDQPLVVRRR
ncbi:MULTISPECIES: thioesterase family protein [Actinoallomurus]|uniref:thioesterase family protein n=1 Tax=Actinoallomurus TaxID=667113 RepID=UPI002090676B|nr:MULTISPECIES: thioesterase family protein [Actinoallomurus]MCO5967631.1 thioesterase family protein [Actinoallomurus soli]MCO5994117.1 thioesterase family protein [Actinoallomurus rhizosphaericola]